MRNKLIIFLLSISVPLFAQQQEEDPTLFFGNTPLNCEPLSNHLNGWYLMASESFVDSTITYNGNKSLCLTSSSPSPAQLFAGYYIRIELLSNRKLYRKFENIIYKNKRQTDF